MSWVRVWVHFVFSTKYQEPLLIDKNLRQQVWNHIIENAKEKHIWLDRVNGYSDHCHCLVSLLHDQNISKVAQLIKGESSRWINKEGLITDFAWQNDYYAVAISESHVNKLRKYIDRQEAHHKKKAFQHEFDEYLQNFI